MDSGPLSTKESRNLSGDIKAKSRVLPPKIPIQIKQNRAGKNQETKRNSRTVLPIAIFPKNNAVIGAQAIQIAKLKVDQS